jgi:pimeloyl-ACP methyl ester carboxylesterase
MIVVGVANTDRYRDLSPVGRPGSPSGIEPFSRFVAGELVPYIEREYRTKDHRILVGPQAGAEFGLYALAHHPDLFDAMILGNPLRSEPVRDLLHAEVMDLAEEGFAGPKFVHIACPDTEGGVGKADEVASMQVFEKELVGARIGNLRLVVRYIQDNRDFLPSLLLADGLRQMFRDYAFPADREVRGLQDVAEHYSALSEQLGFDVDIPERVLALKSDALSATGASDAAMQMLEYLVRAYPRSLDGYWRLANLCREQGDRQSALKYYRRCVEIMPTMRPASDWIIRLEKGDSP